MRTTRSFISSLCFLFCISNLLTISSAVITGSLSVNPGSSQVFATSVTYNFILTSDSWINIPTGATVEVTFPSGYTLPTSFTCTNGASTTLLCSKSGQKIIIENHPSLGSLNSDFRFAVVGITNPSKTGTTGSFSASIMLNSVAQVQSRTTTINISPGAATCSIEPGSPLIGELNIVSFSIKPQNTIPSSGGLTIQAPKWTTINGVSYSMIQFVGCTFSGGITGICTIDQASTYDRIQVRSLSGSISPTTTLTLQFQSIRNPPQNTPYAFAISTLDTSSSIIDQCSPALQVSTPNAITIAPLTFFVCTTNSGLRSINTYDNCALTFTTKNPVPKDAVISVQFPSEVNLDLLGDISETLPSPIDELIGTRNPPLITITNGVDSTKEASTFRLYFNNIKHPSTTAPTESFVITISYNGQPIDRISAGATYTPSAGTLLSSSVRSSPTTATAGSTAALVFTFRIANPVTTASELTITFPSEVPMSDNPSMGCSITGASPSCAMASNVLTVTNYASRDLVNGDSITLTVNGITMPTSTKATSPFVIRTRQGGYNVDMGSSATLTASAASIVTKTIAIPSVPNNPIVGGKSPYRFTFRNVNPIKSDGKIQIQLPNDNSVGIFDEDDVIANTVATIGGTSYTFTSSIDKSLVSPAINITNPTNGQIDTNTEIIITIPSLRNPFSTGSTPSFSIRTYTSDHFLIDETTTGLTITANTMTPAAFNSVTPTLSPSETGQTSTYTFAIVPSISQASTNTITFAFPSDIKFASSVTCRIGITTLSSVACTKIDQSREITMTFGIAVNPSQEFSVSIAGLVNPTVSNTYTDLNITTRLAGGAMVHQRIGGISIPITPSIFSTVNLERSSKNLGDPAVFRFNFRPINTYPPGAYLELKVPTPPLTIRTTPALACQGASGISITGCALKSGDATSIVITVASFAPTSSGITFTVDSIINQQTQQDSGSFELYVKDNNNFVIDQKTSDIIALAPCNSSCLTCLESDRYACTTCSPNGLFPLHDIVNMKCVSGCPIKTYEDNGQCKACNAQCQECSGPDYNQCTACDTTFLHNNECISTCPDKFFANSATKRCQGCSSPCDRCTTNANTCLSCVDGTFLSGQKCVPTCDIGYYGNTDFKECRQCRSNCYTCNSALTCSSCPSTYPIFYDNDCLQECPLGTYRRGSTCEACTGLCATCSFPGSFCLSCKEGLFPLNGQCEACRAPCASCIDSPLSCGSCLGGLFLQGTNCVQSCSDGYYTDYSTSSCRRCSNNCQICSSSSECQTCDASSSTPLLYQGSCVSTCPNNAPVVIDRECIPANTTVIYNPYDGIYLSGLPFPFIIFGGIFSALVGIGRMVSESTLILSNIIGFLSLLEFSSWVALFILLLMSHPGEPVSNYPGMPLILIAIIASIVLNVVFYLRVLRPELKAESFVNWKKEKKSHRRFSLLIQTLSIISFKSFRLLYSKFFGLPFTSIELHNPKTYQHSLNIYTGINFFLSVLMALISAIVTANKDGGDYEQLLHISVEVIILSLIIMILTILDSLRISEAEKRGFVAPDGTTLTVLNAQALSMLEKSIIDKLNESMDTTRKTDMKRPKSRLGAYKRRNSLNLDSSYEYHEGNSSFANLNNTQIGHKTGHKNDDSFSDSAENGHHGKDHYNDAASRVHAIEEIENDDDDQPTLNMKNKTLGQLRDMLKDKGHQLQPDKILIENKDGSIIVLKDKTSFLDNNMNMINGSPSKSMISSIRGFDEEAGRTKISKFMNEDDEAISLTARGRKARGQNEHDKENGGESLQGTIQKHGNEESEEELELHDSYGNLEAKYSRTKIDSLKNLEGKETADYDTINSGVVKRNTLLEPIRIEQDGEENPGNSSIHNQNVSPDKMTRGFDNSLDEAQNYTPSKNDLGKKTNRDNEFMRGSPGFIGKPPTGRTNKSPIGKQDSTHKAPRTRGGDPNEIGVEYLSSDSQHTAEDLHDHFQDDTPSNYDILNQRFAEDVTSPPRGTNSGNNSVKNSYSQGQWGITQSYRTGPRSQLPPVNEVNEPNKKSLSSSPKKYNSNNFLDEEVRNPNLKTSNSNKTEIVHFRKSNQENSARQAEMGKRAMTPQHNQVRRGQNPNATGSRLLSSRGSARSGQGQVGSIGSLNKTAKNFNRGSSVEEDKKYSRVLDSRRNSEEKMKRLESIYSSKIKVPRLNRSNSKSVKQSIANSRGFIDEDNISDQDELELHDFGKFEEIVNKMKKQDESVNKLEQDSIMKETM